MSESKLFWEDILGMKEVNSTDHNVVLTYGEGQCQVELRQLSPGIALNRGTAFGRYAIAYSTDKLDDAQKRTESINRHWIQTPKVKLDTPNKESVYVIVLR